KRRVYGEELASEPSQFLNEMPLELIEDVSRGRSWLSFARGSHTLKGEAGSVRYEDDNQYSDAGNEFTIEETSNKPGGGKYTGKTYDSVESVEEFFRRRTAQMGSPRSTPKSQARSASPKPDTTSPSPSYFGPGSYVRHSKYGRG